MQSTQTKISATPTTYLLYLSAVYNVARLSVPSNYIHAAAGRDRSARSASTMHTTQTADTVASPLLVTSSPATQRNWHCLTCLRATYLYSAA